MKGADCHVVEQAKSFSPFRPRVVSGRAHQAENILAIARKLERIQRKSVLDAYLLWHFSASGRLRFAVTRWSMYSMVKMSVPLVG